TESYTLSLHDALPILLRGDSGGAGGEQEHGVVGGHAAVGVDPVEGDPGGVAQGAVQALGVEVGVGGEDDEHGGEAGGEHACALRSEEHTSELQSRENL